jgi:CRP/FNR family transcriptional regulator, anaerobic regulatory protein
MSISLAQASRAEPASSVSVDAPVRVVRDEVLFRRGQPKTHLYQIEAGTIALYETHVGGAPNIVEFAFSGDIVGFGFLDSHVHSAQAVGEARVRCLPLTALDHVLRPDKRAMHRYAEALQREFEIRRHEVLAADRKPASRLAALFVALSRLNTEEGRDPDAIGDSLDCGTVASYLRLDLDTLGQALVELEKAGLVERSPPHGLRITDQAGLVRFAGEHGQVAIN